MISIAAVMAACSTIGQLTAKDYRAKSAERVMAGHGEPIESGRTAPVTCQSVLTRQSCETVHQHSIQSTALPQAYSVTLLPLHVTYA